MMHTSFCYISRSFRKLALAGGITQRQKAKYFTGDIICISNNNCDKYKQKIMDDAGKRSFGSNKRNIFTESEIKSIKRIKELGYDFNSDGQLRRIDENGKVGSEGFQFNISSDHQECQANYEVLGSVFTEYVYDLLETEVNLVRVPVPKGSTEENGTFVFVSQDYDKKDVLLILIHGSGVVRAGQWARSLIINDSLNSGTQIPYIKEAQSRGYGIIVLNSNDNSRDGKKIKHSSSPEEHAKYVWEEYISKAKATSLLIVAHSYGGVLTLMLANTQKKQFENRVKAVAFTDSVHGHSGLKVTKYLKSVARNWIASTSPLDHPMKTPEFDVCRVSAGHPKHEMTSCMCIDSVFKFFEESFK